MGLRLQKHAGACRPGEGGWGGVPDGAGRRQRRDVHGLLGQTIKPRAYGDLDFSLAKTTIIAEASENFLAKTSIIAETCEERQWRETSCRPYATGDWPVGPNNETTSLWGLGFRVSKTNDYS